MSLFWSLWIMFLIVLNLGITLMLFLWAPRAKIPVRADGTSGHVWAHGVLREGVRPLPMWWIVLSAAMFVIGFIYLALYPGFGRSPGVLGWTAHGELNRNVQANAEKLDTLLVRFRMYTPEQLSSDPAALQMGERLFYDNCAACHGRQGKGNVPLGAPDLTDQDWLYGGDGKAITASIHDGRQGVMPPWASMGQDNVHNLAQYVLSLSGQSHDQAKADAGKALFASTCVACHGPDGKGMTALGAPNLTDNIWLHGGSLADIEASIGQGRHGQMPAWSPRLSDDEIHILAAYVYHLAHEDHGNH